MTESTKLGSAPPPSTETLELHVSSVQAVAREVVEVTLSGSQPLPPWTPGAHLGIHLGNGLLRQYSLCGDPSDREHYRFAVLREPQSRGGSQWVHEALVAGDTLRVDHPRNNFELVDSPAYLFIAGGIGITPILPMVREATERGADWRLLYGGRTRASMAFLEELEHYGDRVTAHPQDEAGLLPLGEWLGTPVADGVAVYTCGPEPLLTAVESATAAWPHGSLHVERFRPPESTDTHVDSAFEVELARSGQVVDIACDKTILETLEDLGMIVLSSCREGTCGTCETKVLNGTPDHRDFVLSDDEKESNETMMVCVSRACTRRLVLDL